MPKRISEKDKKTIYYSYKIGEIRGVSYFHEVISEECQFSTFRGNKRVNYYGTALEYDALAVFEYNERTKFIDEHTKFWYGIKPADGMAVSDFTVIRIGAVSNGLFTVYLSSKTQNSDNLWYAIGDKIYRGDVKFSLESLTAVVPINTYMPIWYSTKVWYREPSDTETTDYAIHLVSIEETESFKKFVFEDGIITDDIVNKIQSPLYEKE